MGVKLTVCSYCGKVLGPVTSRDVRFFCLNTFDFGWQQMHTGQTLAQVTELGPIRCKLEQDARYDLAV